MNLPREAVFAIVDRTGSRAYINYSINVSGALSRLQGELERISRPGCTLELVALSVTTDIETLKLHTEYWRDEYRRQGFLELLPIGRKSLQYEVKLLVDGGYDGVDVALITARGDRKIVGKFRTMGEARDFRDMYYSVDNPYRLPVYATNFLTRKFLLELGKKKSTIDI